MAGLSPAGMAASLAAPDPYVPNSGIRLPPRVCDGEPLAVCDPAPVSRLSGSASGTCFASSHSPWSPPFAPPAPQRATLALFVGFPATMAESDFSRPCIIGYGSSPSRCGPAASAERSIARSPGSRARSVCTCQCLRPRRAVWTLAMSRPSVLPSVTGTTSAPGKRVLSRLNGWPVRSPVNASLMPSRAAAHDSGSMWIGRVGPRRGAGFE